MTPWDRFAIAFPLVRVLAAVVYALMVWEVG